MVRIIDARFLGSCQCVSLAVWLRSVQLFAFSSKLLNSEHPSATSDNSGKPINTSLNTSLSVCHAKSRFSSEDDDHETSGCVRDVRTSGTGV